MAVHRAAEACAAKANPRDTGALPCWLAALLICWAPSQCILAAGDLLLLPERATNAPTGSEFARKVVSLPLSDREREVLREITSGNIPTFLRRLQAVRASAVSASGTTNTVEIRVSSDYLAVGSDADYILIPMRPDTALQIADKCDCILPSRRIVDLIYEQAEVKLRPQPIPPSPAMTTMQVFLDHNRLVRQQLSELRPPWKPGALLAGHKKDVVITPRLQEQPGKVAIYGWHKGINDPIQPLYLGHGTNWVDYSQCVRLVSRDALLNGKPARITEILRDPSLAMLISDEGPFACPPK